MQTGYTHIDCAHIYGNENEIGQGIKDWGGDRKKIWVTSFNIHEEPIVCSPEDAIRVFRLAQLDYLAIGNYLVEREGPEAP